MLRIPPTLAENFELQVLLETVLGVRWNNELGANEWLVKWKGGLNCETTWESVHLMNKQFSTFHLKDKVQFEQGGNVRPPIIHIYKCKSEAVRGVMGVTQKIVCGEVIGGINL